jgi:Leucine-rich repeat (LRR) protein
LYVHSSRAVKSLISYFCITGEVLRSEIFQGPYSEGVYGNIALETLDLAHNEIHSLDRYLFQYTPNLTRLDLSDNPIEILDYVTILALSSATKLEVRANEALARSLPTPVNIRLT